MRIAVDARELTGKPTGVGTYLRHLLDAWATDADASRHEWTLLAHRPLRVPDGLPVRVHTLEGKGGTAWEQWTLPRALARDRCDVLFAPGYSAPLTAPCRIALTVHDVSFAAHPEWFAAREGLRRRTLTTWSARRASVVLTVSVFSKDEIVRRLGIPPDKIRVIAHGIASRRGHEGPPVRSRQPVVLYVGSIFQRRHVDWLIAAFAEVVAPAIPESRLEIVGENRTFPRVDLSQMVARLAPQHLDRIVIREYVDEHTLASLYASAAVFAFPSEYEGFGLTPLEALAAGVPPVVLDTPQSRETYGEAACYVSPGLSNVSDLGGAIAALLRDDEVRRRILARAPAVLARYDWSRAARETLSAIETAAGV